MLEVKNLYVSYGDLKALWGVSFKVEEGEIVGYLGPNGAGKSTTFKTIVGLLKPEKGEITFNGERIDGQPAHRIVNKGIAYVPEGRRLFPYMTVLENLIIGTYPPRARDKKDEMLEWVFQLFPRLKERQNQMAGTLSGGEQQMLAIARALMSNPSLLILDEPSLGLAPKIVEDLFEIIKTINEDGVTILISEQHVHMVFEIMDRGYIIEEGRIVLEGEPSELAGNEHVKKAYLGL